MNSKVPILEARHLTQTFSVSGGFLQPRRTLHALNDVSLSVNRGEVLGIVGESGCGKSTLAKILLGILTPTSGEIFFDGHPISALDRRAVSRRVQPVFQDPYSSLNPRRTLASIVAMPLEVHGLHSPDERRAAAIEMLDMVGLPASYADRTPRELSGGQRQRVAIARALVMKPDLVICDEPTSALDVSVQAQILNLLVDLKRELGLTYIFISHNLAVVEHIADQMMVMYLGRSVEAGPSDHIFRAPRHPYTNALLQSVLTIDAAATLPVLGLKSVFPNPLDPPTGCPFHPRCPRAIVQCSALLPQPVTESGVTFACHLDEATKHIATQDPLNNE